MILYFIRHGNPIYNPDSLTPLGERQAEAIGKRLSLRGVDRIFASTSNRAIMTALPACELLKKEMELLDFCNEKYAWEDLTVKTPKGKEWIFRATETLKLFTDPEVIKMSFSWYEHPLLKRYKKGIDRIYNASDEFLASLGYVHERYTGRYISKEHSDKRVALFAHYGFGLAFLSCILDIPYPMIATRFNIAHTGMTVVEFAPSKNDFIVPDVLTWSSEGHLYHDNIPVTFDHGLNLY